MLNKYAKWLIALLMVTPLLASAATAHAISQREVIEMCDLGVPQEDIIREIAATPRAFDLTDADVQALRTAGVPNAVVAAMLAHHPGAAPPPAVRSAGDVARLHADGYDADELIRAIEANPPFAVSADQLELVRLSGVPDPVIATLARRSLDVAAPPARVEPRPAPRVTAAARPTRARRHAVDRRPPVEQRRGVILAAAAGLNLCVKDSTANCEDIGPGGTFELSAGYRFSQWVSLALDVSYGGYTIDVENVDDSVSMSAVAVMPTVRVHIRAGPRLDFDLGLGIGYAAWDLSSDVDSFSWSSVLAYKAIFGLSLRVSPQLDLGLAVTVYAHPDNGEVCYEELGDETCGDVSGDLNIAERATITFRGTYRFE